MRRYLRRDAGYPYKSFITSIIDLYDYDRALRAATHYEKSYRVRRTGKPLKSARGLSWTPQTPSHVVDAVAEFMVTTSPDEFWIDSSEGPSGTDTTIYHIETIYARFGSWDVVVSQWSRSWRY